MIYWDVTILINSPFFWQNPLHRCRLIPKTPKCSWPHVSAHEEPTFLWQGRHTTTQVLVTLIYEVFKTQRDSQIPLEASRAKCDSLSMLVFTFKRHRAVTLTSHILFDSELVFSRLAQDSGSSQFFKGFYLKNSLFGSLSNHYDEELAFKVGEKGRKQSTHTSPKHFTRLNELSSWASFNTNVRV